MTNDWITIAMSALALFVSVLSFGVSALSFRRSGQTKQREWRIAVRERATEIGMALGSVPRRARTTKGSWRALFAATNMFESGARQNLEAQIETKEADAKSLRDHLGTVTTGVENMSDAELETALVQLRGLQRQTDNIVDWFDAKDAEHSRRVEERRRQFEGGAGP